MKFDEFAASFKNPEGQIPCGELGVEKQGRDVVLAGTILTATKESCCLDINGAQYEIAASNVIDIQVISPTGAGKVAADVPNKGPQIVLVKVNSNTVLCRRIPVQAALVAAAGTWVSVVSPAAKAAEEPRRAADSK